MDGLLKSESPLRPTLVFLSGTGTDVGKTYAGRLLLRAARLSGRRVGVYKPVASGCRMSDGRVVADDAVALWDAAGRPRTLSDVCPQRFAAPLAPPEAAMQEGTMVDPQRLVDGLNVWLDGNFDWVLVEGAGGLFSPISEDWTNLDLLQKLPATKLIVVASNRLGVIHDVLATCRAAECSGTTVDEVILNQVDAASDGSIASNSKWLRRLTTVPSIREVSHGQSEL